ncbi:MAG: hypothetical protein M3138_00750 [Actinomycetota bacterium]|nr:hypothetical protein [Actinomycetota bacterium]
MASHGGVDPRRTSGSGDPEGPSPRERSLARGALIIVGAGVLIAQFALISADRPPGWDESIYLSQVTPGMDAMLLRAFRARGITYLVAPITLPGGSVEHVRLFLMVLSSVALAATFYVTIPLVGAAAPIAAVFLASSWLYLFNGSIVLPNLWAAILGLAAAVLTARRVEGGGTRSMVLAAISLGVMALFRPTEATVVFAAIGLSLLLWRRASRRLIVPLGVALILGFLPWLVEMSVRFGGTLRALEVAHTEHHLSLADAGMNLVAYLAATDGEAFIDIPIPGALWWAAMIVLSVVAIRRSNRSLRTVVILCCVGALSLAVEYVAFVTAVAPRFLLPAYAFAALPAAVGLVSLLRGTTNARYGGALIALLMIPWMVWQVRVADRVADRQHGSLLMFREVGLELRKMAGGQPCAFMSPHGWPAIEFAAGCRGSILPRPRGPSDHELRRLSTSEVQGFVILRLPPRPRSVLSSIEPASVRGPKMTWYIYEIPMLPEGALERLRVATVDVGGDDAPLHPRR